MPGPRPSFPARRRVALLVESSNEYGRGLLRGIAAYLRAHRSFSVQVPEMSRGGPAPAWLAGWDGDGILARVENEAIAAAVRAAGLPTVDLSASRLLPEVPWVEVDEAAVASLAIDHLRGRGFDRLAFCGDPRFSWSRLRGAAFAAEAARRGIEAQCVEVPAGVDRVTALTHWLPTLRRPVGVFACYDAMGRDLLEAARGAGILVPQELVVLGVDGDELICDFTDPPLSSIELDGHRTGECAASLLVRAMDGEAIAPEGHLVPPLGLTLRRSTDALAVEDLEVARALNMIERHACAGLRVADIVSELPLSRRALETRFKDCTGRSIHQEILLTRIGRVRSLLAGTDLTVAEIARQTGYRHVEYLTVAFKRAEGCTPSAYRARTSSARSPVT